MLVTSYNALENENVGTFLFFEYIPAEANQQYSLDWLLVNRDLHMDMLRESGRRADAHISRYIYAARKVRPNDVVVDAACGLGYGTAVLAACSQGARFIGVDIDADSVNYAALNFASLNPTLSYQAADVTKLSFLPDHSVDVLVSFETIEHIEDYDLFLKEAKRILKPDGRFIGSVPNLWCDETGKDPNPHHYHVFDWNKLKKAIESYFIVDERVAQIAGGGYKLWNGVRIMQTIPVNYEGQLETEWWIVSACVNPLYSQSVPYTNSLKDKDSEVIPLHIDFAKYYDNPWIYRTMVQLGERISDRQVLSDFCSQVARTSRQGSSDQGAALCVIAYQLLESGDVKINEVSNLIEYINLFEKSCDNDNPHCIRWLISLHYIGGRLLLALGKREEALAAFMSCAKMDPLVFSPLLATKTISARMYIGLLQTSLGNIENAREQFVSAISEAHRVIRDDWTSIVGDLSSPLLFGLSEAAEVLDIASQCAQALHALSHQESVPGFLWDRVKIKRFGLVEWNKSLERENATLRQELMRLQFIPQSRKAEVA